jgi:hypothetical protein
VAWCAASGDRKMHLNFVVRSRFQSTSAVDPKTRANSIIEALPGNSVVSK